MTNSQPLETAADAGEGRPTGGVSELIQAAAVEAAYILEAVRK